MIIIAIAFLFYSLYCEMSQMANQPRAIRQGSLKKLVHHLEHPLPHLITKGGILVDK